MRWCAGASSRATSRSTCHLSSRRLSLPADPSAWVREHVPHRSRSIAFARVWRRLASRSTTGSSRHFWPRCGRRWRKMKRRDDKYRAAREAAFTIDVGRRYLRELSIDELPGFDDSRNDCGHAVAMRGARHAHRFRGSRFRLSEEHAVPGQRRAPRRSSKNSGPCAARSTRALAFTPDRVSRPKTTR